MENIHLQNLLVKDPSSLKQQQQIWRNSRTDLIFRVHRAINVAS